MKHSNDILKPIELISEHTKQEFVSDNDGNTSTTSSENSQCYPKLIRRVVPWVEIQTFTDLELANEYVKDTTTRDTTRPVCVYIKKSKGSKHKMIQQTRLCRSNGCKKSEKPCKFKIKYQKCVICKKATVYESGQHSVGSVICKEEENETRVIEETIVPNVCEISTVEVIFPILIGTVNFHLKGDTIITELL
jgi:hypothetical protein